MALFGAPTAHEDDPERAVRAALAIRDFAVEEALELRVGITTGEALVRLDAQPGRGRGHGLRRRRQHRRSPAGRRPRERHPRRRDDLSRDARRHRVRGGDAGRGEGQGGADRGLGGVAAHSRFGVDVAHEARSELVGRERELAIVRDAFERARHERTPQLVTLVGVPGIGKSRLVYELQRIVEADPELITWRQGRCLAYGDGIALWALGEIVKAQAGILEQDTPDGGRGEAPRSGRGRPRRIRATRRWVESHLRPLVGLAGEDAARRRPPRARPSPPGGGSSRRSPSSGRSSSSSRTSTGPTRACSTSSTSSSTG